MRFLVLGLLYLIGCLPLLVLHGAGNLIGALLWLIPNKTRELARVHVKVAFPEMPGPERDRIVRTSVRHMGMTLMEAPAIWFGPRWRLQRWIDDAPARAQLQAIAAGGAVLLCPHVGSWELAGMFCAASAPITSLYKPQKGVFDELIKEGRARLGAKLAPSTIHGV